MIYKWKLKLINNHKLPLNDYFKDTPQMLDLMAMEKLFYTFKN